MKRARPLAASVLVAALMAGAQPTIAAESPFEGQLVRLAEVLGSLHYLRNLCGEDSRTWRDRMQALLEAENPDEARRTRFVASFNRGYRSYEGTYSSCTESAIEAINRFVREGEALTRDTASRFGNQ
ncbi:TIGR02301 family protein [Mesorhizobium sp. CAU 1732]|uniref:TIGR02301 family protein n=1 Tax=Mesorhizobium sp. CAU 1732 TaxID=3140358 RepID=UPI0032600174